MKIPEGSSCELEGTKIPSFQVAVAVTRGILESWNLTPSRHKLTARQVGGHRWSRCELSAAQRRPGAQHRWLRTRRHAGRVLKVEASAVAVEVLSGVGTRLEHSRGVARQAVLVASALDSPWRAALVDAAWLHDVGYCPSVATTGFHPLDGARWLRSRGWPPEVCRLVAWHTRAGTEAELRHLAVELAGEFPPPPDDAQAALTWADLTSSPQGHACTAADRLAEILGRYPPESVVHRATSANLDDLLLDALLIETKLEASWGGI